MVDFGVDQPRGTGESVADEFPRCLLSLANPCERRAAEAQSSGLSKIDQVTGLFYCRSHWFFAMNMFAGVEAGACHLVVGVVNDQVHGDVHRGIG